MLMLTGLISSIPMAGAPSGRPLFQHTGSPRDSPGDEALIRLIERPTTFRATIAKVDRHALEEARVQLNPFPELNLEAVESGLPFSGSHHRAWFGTLTDKQGSVVLIINGDRISGKINSCHGTFELFPLGKDECIIVEHNTGQFPPCAAGRHPRHSPSGRQRPGVKNNSTDPVEDTPQRDVLPPDGSTEDTPTGNRVRVIVAYTSGARYKTRTVYGRTMQEHIDLTIAEANQGYASSGVDLRVELACLYKTDFVESNAIEDDVDAFQENGDGKADEVHQLRDDYDADMCCLITDGRDFAWCGDSYGFDYTSRDNMFQATSYACATGNLSFAHEFGHTQGCRHNDDGELTPFPYGHGFRNESNWRTIMALANATVAPRLNYWSNPEIDSPVAPFTPMGTPVDGQLFANDSRSALNAGDDIVINHETTPFNSSAPTGGVFASDEYADKVVTGSLMVAEFTASGGSTINFRAGTSIVLQAGFHAQEGCRLRARLADPMDEPASTGLQPEASKNEIFSTSTPTPLK
jgi:hypothetical protein